MLSRTVLELDDKDIASYSIALASRPLNMASPELVSRARMLAVNVARLLRLDYGAKKVWLFGSLANGVFSATSDLDIAYQGIEPSLYFRICAKISDIAAGLNVDLVDMDDCKPVMRQEILEKGIAL